MSLTPKNWNTFQHYKDRSPSWIKLHRGLLDDYAFIRLPLASQALAPRLWLLASEYKDGEITADLDEIAFRLHASLDDVRSALKPLVDAGFFIDASDTLAACKHNACLEKEKEEETQVETEKRESTSLRSVRSDVRRETFLDDWPPDYREQFWAKYPRKVGRKSAIRKLEAIRRSGEVTWERLCGGVLKIPKGEPKFIPHPLTWLNRGGWDDEEVQTGGANGCRGSRSLQDNSLSVGRAAERLATEVRQGNVQFAPRPSLLPRQSQDDLRLLPPGRSTGP